MRRELIATLGSVQRSLTVEGVDGGRWRVSIDGRARSVDARRIRPGTWSLLIDGRSWVVDLDERARGTVAMTRGSESSILVEDARQRRLAAAVSHATVDAVGGEVILAPIAGRVVKLLVAEGARVAAGQGVCVLEAMKMENEIAAERGGTVASVHVAVGDSVETREPLVTLT